MANIPDWLRVLIHILVLLLILFLSWQVLNTARMRERRRSNLRCDLLQSRIKLMQQRIRDLENALQEAKIKSTVVSNCGAADNRRVFISYSHKDYEIANGLRTLLVDSGIACYMAPESIPAGSNYTKEIPDAICNCFAMVVVLSTYSQDSPWVPKEIDLALNENVPIIPYLIDDMKINRQFRFLLGQCQHINSIHNASAANDEIIARLKALRSASATTQ